MAGTLSEDFPCAAIGLEGLKAVEEGSYPVSLMVGIAVHG